MPYSNPKLITAMDERYRCCVLDSTGNRCKQRSKFWVGANGIDDYTYVCGDHVEDVKREGDTVARLEG